MLYMNLPSPQKPTRNANGNGIGPQDCNNGGLCVAPDVCKCARWDNAFRDGREAGGRPLFLKPNGDPQQTGWTGYDCSVPICVQVGETELSTGTSNCALLGLWRLVVRPPWAMELQSIWTTTRTLLSSSSAGPKMYPNICKATLAMIAVNHGKILRMAGRV